MVARTSKSSESGRSSLSGVSAGKGRDPVEQSVEYTSRNTLVFLDQLLDVLLHLEQQNIP